MPKKKPSKKKTTRRKPPPASGCQFGKLKVPRNVRVRDSGLVDGDNPDYNPHREDYEAWGDEEECRGGA